MLNEDLNRRIRRLGFLIVLFILLITIISLISIQPRQILLSPLQKSSRLNPNNISASKNPSKKELITGEVIVPIPLINANLNDVNVGVSNLLPGGLKYIEEIISHEGYCDEETGLIIE
jgi:hypothetical protein